MNIVSFPVPDELAEQLPAESSERQQILEYGLREWRLRHALEAYRQGGGSLAYAAQQAGISLREIIPLAYAHGIVPQVDPETGGPNPLTLDQASEL